jgi:hypothetical protein
MHFSPSKAACSTATGTVDKDSEPLRNATHMAEMTKQYREGLKEMNNRSNVTADDKSLSTQPKKKQEEVKINLKVVQSQAPTINPSSDTVSEYD